MYTLFKTTDAERPHTPTLGGVSLQELTEQTAIIDLDPPAPSRLTSLCSRENLFYGIRSLGAGLLSTGLTSIGCDYMMVDSPEFKLTQGFLVGIGLGVYFAGSADVSNLQTKSDYQEHFQQCARDAVVPVVTAMSVYLARSHWVI